MSSLAFAPEPARAPRFGKGLSGFEDGVAVFDRSEAAVEDADPKLLCDALAGRYVVVEVGFYPADGKTVDIERSNFALVSSDGKSSVTPATPEQIASILQKRPASSRDVTLYPQANVDIDLSCLHRQRDQASRRPRLRRWHRGWRGQDDIAGDNDSDRKTMETELSDKQFKSGEVSSPVAGYLYFPSRGKEKWRISARIPWRRHNQHAVALRKVDPGRYSGFGKFPFVQSVSLFAGQSAKPTKNCPNSAYTALTSSKRIS